MRSLPAALAATALLLAGCATTRPITAGAAAPGWTLQDTDGVTRSLSDYRGRVVLMDFWATWCAPCRRSSPHIQALADRYGDAGLVVLGFQHSDDADPRPYLRDHGVTYPVFARADEVAAAYGAGLPSFVIVGRQGRVALHKGGFADGDEALLAEAVERELAR